MTVSILNKKCPPVPRPGIYQLYWTFAAQRQAAFERRLAGQHGPWSEDPILQRFKFCNVFRAADRVSQYLIHQVAYRKTDDTADNRLFQIAAFRTFSKITTWEGLIARIGRPPKLEDLASGSFESALEDIKKEQGGLYTGAFILCANKAFGFAQKHKNHVALFKYMFLKNQAGKYLLQAASLAEVVKLLESFPLIGPFMSYQIAIDLNYSELLNFDENDYTQAGPGALRGLAKIFTNLGEYTPSQAILWMVENQEKEFKRWGLQFGGLWGRPLHAIDCQGLFCEVDKYCRQAAPQLRSNRSRIKTRFTPSSAPLPLFFPPKWGINNHLALKIEKKSLIVKV